MKQLHLTGKFACALIFTAAIVSGCKKKDADVPPPVPEATPAPAATPAPVTNTPTTDGGTATQPNPAAPATDSSTTPATTPATTPPANR
jgi:hypothetical protein